MRHHRLKVILLSLGVLLGYGAAAGRAFYWHEHGHGWYGGHCEAGKPTPG